jgi:methanethiol S-methyltransferase
MPLINSPKSPSDSSKASRSACSKIIPAATERSLFILLAGIILWVILLFWPCDDSIVWNVSHDVTAKAILGLAVLGWIYMFLAIFAINHFELLGLQQTFNYFRDRNTPETPYVERLMYKFDRHPIMTGALIGMWVTPVMRMDHLLFSLFFTIYIIVGVSFKEKSLIELWGEDYISYKRRVASVVPTFRPRVNKD